jgi:hypothetical protein
VHHPRVGVGPPLLALLVVLPGLAVAPPALASPASGGSVRAPARAPAPIRPADVRGVYRVRGTARISARPLMDRDEEVYADATLEPGSGRDVRVALATEGERCTLVARLSDDGALAFADGQSCRLKLDGPDARGAVERGSSPAAAARAAAASPSSSRSGSPDASRSAPAAAATRCSAVRWRSRPRGPRRCR